MTGTEINIVGAGLAGLTAAITLAEEGRQVNLISLQTSERAQSVLAAGGINGALNTMGEEDCTENHYQDTLRAGVFTADPEAVRGMTEAAPEIIRWLDRLGVPFNRTPEGDIMQRNFGGQKKKRTAYSRSSTGKMLMTALIDETRRYEAAGMVVRYPHHEMKQLLFSEASEVAGVLVKDVYTGAVRPFYGPVILAFGGMNGMFPGRTTGTTANSADAAAAVFMQGVRFSNLEMLQYHPTTMGIAGKRCLVSEAARGEGGRLFIRRGGKDWYFMDEKYPELGSLMPRDVVSREMDFVRRDPATEGQVYLDMRHLSEEIWRRRLADLREEILHYFALDPKKEPLPVEPGIHYFMGGIDVDVHHRTSVGNLYAAGECCSQYHGANRLGGNSMLGAIYGGRTAARDLLARPEAKPAVDGNEPDVASEPSPALINRVAEILGGAMSIVRNGAELTAAEEALLTLMRAPERNEAEQGRIALGLAMIRSAALRRESRGAHFREDYPERDEAFRGLVEAVFREGDVQVLLRPTKEKGEGQ